MAAGDEALRAVDAVLHLVFDGVVESLDVELQARALLPAEGLELGLALGQSLGLGLGADFLVRELGELDREAALQVLTGFQDGGLGPRDLLVGGLLRLEFGPAELRFETFAARRVLLLQCSWRSWSRASSSAVWASRLMSAARSSLPAKCWVR